jgi:hypothetical protein
MLKFGSFAHRMISASSSLAAVSPIIDCETVEDSCWAPESAVVLFAWQLKPCRCDCFLASSRGSPYEVLLQY